MKKKLIMLLFFTLFCSLVFGMIFGGSNLSFTGYPDCDCYPPSKPYQFNSQYEIDSFNQNVDSYINCVNDYLDNANNDIERIYEAKQDALDEANRYINSLK